VGRAVLAGPGAIAVNIGQRVARLRKQLGMDGGRCPACRDQCRTILRVIDKGDNGPRPARSPCPACSKAPKVITVRLVTVSTADKESKP
jgi:hypothetical protein